MLVTRDVWREESYSGDSETDSTAKSIGKVTTKTPAEPAKKAEPPKPQAKPPPKPAAGAKKAGQSTLAGFFKKK